MCLLSLLLASGIPEALKGVGVGCVCERQRGYSEEQHGEKEEKGVPWSGRAPMSTWNKKVQQILPCLHHQL